MSAAHVDHWRDRAEKLAKGLLEIAELAMPDTYFATDSRCQLAREVLKDAQHLKRIQNRTEGRCVSETSICNCNCDQLAHEQSMQHALSQIPPSLRTTKKKRSTRGKTRRR